MNIPRFAIQNRTVVVVAMVLTIFWGMFVYENIPRNEDPVFTSLVCSVYVSWPGASVEKIEELVAVPIEEAISGVNEVDIRLLESHVRVGSCFTYVNLVRKLGTTYNAEDVWTKIQNKVNRVSLPEGASRPFVDSGYNATEAMMLAVYPLYHEKYSYEDLRKLAKKVQEKISGVKDVGRVLITGTQQEVINLEVKSGVWSRLNISSDKLAQDLQNRNIVAPGGSLDGALTRYAVKLSGEFETANNIEKVVVGESDQSPVYLKDLGIKITRTIQDPPRLLCRYQEKDFVSDKCIIVSFPMRQGGNIVKMGHDVRDQIQKISSSPDWPKDVRLKVVSDQPKIVEGRITEFSDNLFQGMFVVAIIGFLMVSFRVAVVIATSIPLTLIASISLMPLFGVELEQMSIAALMVSLGLLVDNAIEVADNIHRLMMEGNSIFDASWRGAQEIALPVLSATLTTVAAFLPMLLVPAETGEFIRSLAIVVTVTLLLSWLVAMSVTTLMSFWLIRPTGVQGGIIAFFVRFWIASSAVLSRVRSGQGGVIPFARRLWKWVVGSVPISEEDEDAGFTKRNYSKILKTSIRFRFLVVAAAVGLLFISSFASQFVGSQFFPLAFRDHFLIDIRLPGAVSRMETMKVTQEVERIVRRLSETEIEDKKVERLDFMLSFVGGGSPRFYVVLDAMQERHNVSQIVVNTTDPALVDSYIKDIRQAVNSIIPGVNIGVKKLNLGTSPGSPVAFRVIGENPNEMRPVMVALKGLLAKNQDVIDVYDDWEYSNLQLKIDIKEDLANVTGVTNQDVAKTMNTYLSGQYLTTFREGEHKIPVYLRLPKEERKSIHNLESFYVEGREGRIPIDSIATPRVIWSDSIIKRRSKEKTMTIFASTYEDVLPVEVVNGVMPQIEEIREEMQKKYPKTRIEIAGEWENKKNADEDFALAGNVTLIAIIFILVCQFNGIIKPFLILVSLPLALAGSIFGLIITGWPFNFMAQLGMFSLFGIVLNDSIVLIEFMDHELKKCRGNLEECIVRAAKMRVVPILLTSFTTAGGLLPLAIYGGPLWKPMAFVIIFGLVNSTFLSLIVVPSIYMILARDFKVNLVEGLQDKIHGKSDDEEYMGAILEPKG